MKPAWCLVFFGLLIFAPLDLFGAPHLYGDPEPVIAGIGRFLVDPTYQSFPGDAGRRAAAAPTAVSALILRVDFEPDHDEQTRRITGSGVWSDPAYAYGGDSDYWVKKNSADLVAYYHEVSRGRLLLRVDIAPAVYRLPGKMAEYGTETAGAVEMLIRDSVLAFAASGVGNLQDYDVLLIVHAGPGEETDFNRDSPGDLWSLFYTTEAIWDENGQPLVVDGITVNQAIILPQTGVQDGETVDPFGLYAHEFAHFLGLPDLYPTNWISTWAGVGAWCLMGDGLYNRADEAEPWGSSPAHLSAWAKSHLGWISPQVLAPHIDPGRLMLDPINGLPSMETTGQVLKLAAGPNTANTFFLLENRQRLGYDLGLPGSGLLVWLIAEDVIENGLPTNSVNNNRWRPGVMLVEADGDYDLRRRLGIASGGDPFPGETNNRILSPQSAPPSRPLAGPAWVNLKDIDEVDGQIQLTIGFSPPPPVLDRARLQCDWTTIEFFPPEVNDLAGYRLYSDDVLAGSTTVAFFDQQGITEHAVLSLTAVDELGHESDRSIAFTAVPEDCPGGGNGGCFIASAAFGNHDDPAVRELRLFRDRFLLTNTPGQLLVRTYYDLSPILAKQVQSSFLLQSIIRTLLMPLVLLATLANMSGSWGLLAVLILLCVAGVIGPRFHRARS